MDIQKQTIKTLRELVHAHQRERRIIAPCEHGHFECSCWTQTEGGPCLDEVLSELESRGDYSLS